MTTAIYFRKVFIVGGVAFDDILLSNTLVHRARSSVHRGRSANKMKETKSIED